MEERATVDGDSSNANDDGLRDADGFVRTETKAVRYVKTLFFLVLIMFTCASGWAVFKYARGVEEHNFRSKYADYSAMVVRVFLDNVDRKLKTARELSITVTSYAKRMNMTWPMVAIPDFQLIGALARKQSDAVLVSLVPVVHKSQRAEWEAFSIANQGWLDEKPVVRLLQPQNSSNIRKLNALGFGIPRSIFTMDDKFHPARSVGDGPFLPLWQSSPLPSTPVVVNYDLLSYPLLSGPLHAMLESKRPVIGYTVMLEPQTKNPIEQELIRMVAMQTGKKYEKGPVGALYYPVFHDFAVNSPLVAIIGMEIFWQDYFTDLLPPNANGTICVLKSSCGEIFTYQIMGPDVIFLGPGDLHDPGFDEFEEVAGVGVQSKQFRSYQCQFKIHVYPSEEMRRAFITGRPENLTLAVVLVMVFSSLVFVLYDYFAERRQSKVMATAARAFDMVFSLFPPLVRDRLFGSENDTDSVDYSEYESTQLSQPSSVDRGTAVRFETLTRRLSAEHGKPATAQKPIADLFLNTTVLFADIAGFDDWSADRDPTLVFVLLETLFRSFDKCARRKGVFKVETIQDCYMAVTGLPVPQADHAVIMVQFAVDCMTQMDRVLNLLEPTLGSDVKKLALRIGVHSGPVTAGVLRGDKSRFQLFGDTVNTAARMQTTGLADNIQISQDTANVLSSAGKSSWYLARKDQVTAKGKGVLQTYWLTLDG